MPAQIINSAQKEPLTHLENKMPPSPTSTTSEKPTVDRFEKYYKLVGVLTAVGFFVSIQKILFAVWPSMLERFSPLGLKLFFFTVIPTLVSLIFYAVMEVVYRAKLPVFERYRMEPEKKWLWESNPEEWKKIFKKTSLSLARKELIFVPVLTYLTSSQNPRHKISLEDFPSVLEICFHLCIFMVISDSLFYWMHRILHHPKLYRHFHKVHHGYRSTVAIGSTYLHPVDYLLTNFLPFTVSFSVIEGHVHLATLAVWAMVMPFIDISNHTGYDFPWNPLIIIPFTGGDDYHYFHHSHNVGNYGDFFPFWDNLFGTNKRYHEFVQKKQNKVHQIKQEQ